MYIFLHFLSIVSAAFALVVSGFLWSTGHGPSQHAQLLLRIIGRLVLTQPCLRLVRPRVSRRHEHVLRLRLLNARRASDVLAWREEAVVFAVSLHVQAAVLPSTGGQGVST